MKNIIKNLDNFDSHYKSPNYTDCFKRCPCPLWLNCRYYTDITEQYKRLKKKQLLPEIIQWYEDYFRTHVEARGECTNG